MPKEEISIFRQIVNIEGWSFLILLFIAMPMKYMMGYPLATKIVGMIHGVLFIYYIIMQFKSSQKYGWTLAQNLKYFIASLIPFGTFYIKNELIELENQYKQEETVNNN
ncbi:MAG: DUF3817 domain-containing protein [Campylobacterota bacterium]|nr:DUF3817 domain-containing protein [Campylobacterota bacterium]